MPDIFQQLLIGAPVKRVYEAITSQEGLAAWWTPLATTTAELNSVARFPFGDDYFKEMKIIALKPPRTVEWFCQTGDAQWVGTNLSFELAGNEALSDGKIRNDLRGQIEQLGDVADSTIVSFRHNNWKDYTPMFAECSYTWAMFLRSLKLLCETGKGRPWPEQHRI